MSKEATGERAAGAAVPTSALKDPVSAYSTLTSRSRLARGHRHILGLVAVFALFTAIAAGAAGAARAYTISGTVTAQSTGLGVAQTEVSVAEASNNKIVATTTTELNGGYTVSVPTGTYNITYTPPLGSGYSSFVDRGETISSNRTVNVVLVPAGSVTFSGVVRGEGGVAVPDAHVRVGGEEVEANSEGAFEVHVAPGSYELNVWGYR